MKRLTDLRRPRAVLSNAARNQRLQQFRQLVCKLLTRRPKLPLLAQREAQFVLLAVLGAAIASACWWGAFAFLIWACR